MAHVRIAMGSCTGCTIPIPSTIRYDPSVPIILLLLEWIVTGIMFTPEIRFRVSFLLVPTIDFGIVCVQLLSFQFLLFLLVYLRIESNQS